MAAKKPPRSLPFGAVLGYAPGGVPAYSSDYATADSEQLPTRHHYRQYLGEIYTGYKWQCVEFARRWLLLNCGFVFDDVAMAYEIFRLRQVHAQDERGTLPLKAFANGCQCKPAPGSMLIWDEGGEFDVTGHVAIITAADQAQVFIAEQNYEHHAWPEGCDYSRRLTLDIGADGEYWIRDPHKRNKILGWVTQTADGQYALTDNTPERALFQLQLQHTRKTAPDAGWLDLKNPTLAAYVNANGEHLCGAGHEHQFFCISQTAQSELKRATNELHGLFMHATDYVLQNPELLSHFNLPEVIWPRIQQSWDNRRNQMISGRFDFAMTEAGLKVYEYNCDSASCHTECGKIQALWAKHMGCKTGRDAGRLLFEDLEDAWENSEAKGLVHILLDNDKEELYHALFMQETMAAANIPSKLVHGVKSLRRDDNGDVVDADGETINWVWKTWAWETALDQLREELSASSTAHTAPQLKDVLFQPHTMVFEPLWTLIPSNKAILPILWQLFPDNPYLLESHFELNDSLRAEGYVTKPIAGRCGFNIQLVGEDSELLESTSGQFQQQNQIFQALFSLPYIAPFHAQLCTFTSAGSFSGSCVRVDSSRIITTHSNLMPLRVVTDRSLLKQ